MPKQVPMPKMLYGTAWKEERTKDLVVLALQSGFRGIDTAAQPKHYRVSCHRRATQTCSGES